MSKWNCPKCRQTWLEEGIRITDVHAPLCPECRASLVEMVNCAKEWAANARELDAVRFLRDFYAGRLVKLDTPEENLPDVLKRPPGGTGSGSGCFIVILVLILGVVAWLLWHFLLK